MPNLIKIDTQEYPVSLREFRERFKNTSFPVQIPFADFGYAVVFDVPQPIHTRLQRAKELAPEISPLGKYQQVWEVVNLQDEMIPEDYQALLDRFAVEDAAAAAAAAAQQAAIAAKEELAFDQISKKSYTEIETYIRGVMTGVPVATVDLIVKMGKLIKALVDR